MRRLTYVGGILASVAVLLAVCGLFRGANRPVIGDGSVTIAGPPRIHPDYNGCVIPPNIAPLNFRVEEAGTRYLARIRGERGEPIEVSSRTGGFAIPPRQWRRLLEENQGGELRFDVYVQDVDGHWGRYETVKNQVAHEEIDGYIAYRLIDPAYNVWDRMRICQRDLETYRESVILDNASVGFACVNCHTFLNRGTDKTALQMRQGGGQYGSGMLVITGGSVTKVDTRTEFCPMMAVYPAWHPSGKLLAFSANKVRQFFHTVRPEARDVVDLDSDLGIYLPESNEVTSTAAISQEDRLETYPTWSPDGRYLYFSSAPVLWPNREDVPPKHYDEVRYELMRIGYDVATGSWGKLETVLSAAETGKSVTQPRISPDGRFLLFCMSDYGCFPIFQESADLYMMDLTTGQYRRLEINSDRTDSWHSWSGNGRWIVFSSKRLNGLTAQPYFSYVDAEGRVHKPFVLPQKDPGCYDELPLTYNVPELAREPVRVTGEGIARTVRSEDWVKAGLPVTSASPRVERKAGAASPAEPTEPWRPSR